MLTYLLLIITKQNKKKTGRAETAKIFAANVWSEMLIPVKFRDLTKGSKECSPALSSQKLERRRQHWLRKGTAQGKHTHQLHGEWSWRCKLKTPNSFLPPLPASVLAGIRHKKSNWCHLPRRALLWFTAQDKNKSEKQADSSAIWGQEREFMLNCCLEQRRFDLPVTASSTPDCCPVTSQIPNWLWAFLWAASGQSDRSQYKHTLTKTDVKNKAASVLRLLCREQSKPTPSDWARFVKPTQRLGTSCTSGAEVLPPSHLWKQRVPPLFPWATTGMRDKVLKVRLWSFPCRNSK